MNYYRKSEIEKNPYHISTMIRLSGQFKAILTPYSTYKEDWSIIFKLYDNNFRIDYWYSLLIKLSTLSKLKCLHFSFN
jgi:hypothetical protein